MKIDLLVTFSVTKEENPEASRTKIEDILIDGEEINLAYSHVRDKVWFTSKRIIAMDVQGLTESKKEFRTQNFTFFPGTQNTSAGFGEATGEGVGES